MDPKDLSIQDFDYHLPDEKIALYPLNERDSSRLMVYQQGGIRDEIFKNIGQYLPDNSLLVFNETKVIKARIRFQKQTRGIIEVFCLEPHEPGMDYSSVMHKKGKVSWKCMIGGVGKWKKGELEKKLITNNEELIIRAVLIQKLPEFYIVEFSWSPSDWSFAEIILQFGEVPLPPYIKRQAEPGDIASYQTIYAKDEGSVAAPTAGLHFTPGIFESFGEKKILKEFITLHVGAGTFKPVKTATMRKHLMHEEWISVEAETIKNLLSGQWKKIIAVGTTTARTLETIYWLGVKIILDPCIKTLELGQWEVYEEQLMHASVTPNEALNTLLHWLKQNNFTRLFTKTQLLIVPSYRFRIIKGVITNFHQPQSTLLLLVAAAIGEDWKRLYDHALENEYRFLSYGDGCLILINE